MSTPTSTTHITTTTPVVSDNGLLCYVAFGKLSKRVWSLTFLTDHLFVFAGNKWPTSTGSEQVGRQGLTQSNTTGLDDISAADRLKLNEHARQHSNDHLSSSKSSAPSSDSQSRHHSSGSSNSSTTGSSADSDKATTGSSEHSGNDAASGGALTGAATNSARSGKDGNEEDPNSGPNSNANRATGSSEEVKDKDEKTAGKYCTDSSS